MRAVWYERFGPAEEVLQVGERETPEPGPGEVLVKLETSGVNPSDTKKRLGSFPDLLAAGYVIPHSDGAGIVEAVGRGVPASRLGERVWVYQAQYARRFGTAAEYVAVADARAPWLPDEADFDAGACLGIPAMTAHRCVFADGSVDRQTVLVTGGAGRVGFYAVQWAKHGGATVIATASGARGTEDCLLAGADHVVDHRADDFVEAVRDAAPGGLVDRVVDVDFGGNLPRNLDYLRTGGVIATYASGSVPEPTLPFFRMMYMDLTVRTVIVYAMPEAAKQEAIDDITAFLERRQLQHRIVQRLPLAEVAKAHELIERGGLNGCVVVGVGPR